MIIKNIKIGERLAIGFTLVLLTTAFIGLISINAIKNIASITNQMYDHPMTVSNVVRDIRANINAMHYSLNDVVLTESFEAIEKTSQDIDNYERQIYRDFEIISSRFLGDKADVEHAKTAFSDWKVIRDEVILLCREGKKGVALNDAIGKSNGIKEHLNAEIQIMINSANEMASNFLQDSSAKMQSAVYILSILIVALIIFGLVVSHYISRSIVTPLKLIVNRLTDISQGYLNSEVDIIRQDEIGELADSFRELQTDLREKAHLAERIANLDFSIDIPVRSERDDLGKSFSAMTNSLRNKTSDLIKSEEEYRLLSTISPVGVYKTDEKGNCLFVNEKWQEIAGISLEKELGEDWIEGLHLKDKERVINEWNECVKEDKPFRSEYRFKNEKEITWVLGQAIAERDSDGIIKGYVGTITDITERKKAEDSIRQSEEQFRDLIEKANIAICIEDNDGNVTYSNEINASMHGYSLEEIMTKNIKDLVHPEDYEMVIKNHNKRIKNEHLLQYEYRGLRKDGSFIWMEVDGVRNVQNGKVIGTRNYFWDISEHKKAEEIIRESEQRLSAIFEGSRDAIFLSGTDAKFTSVNNAACELTGYSKEELLGMEIPDLHEEVDLDAFNQFFDNIIAGEKVLSEAKILKKDGTKTDSEFNSQSIEIQGIQYMHTVARDISERKKTEKALKESEKRFKDIVYNMADWVWEVDLNGEYTYASGNIKEILGYEPEEVIGKTPFDLMDEAEAEKTKEVFLEILNEKQPITDLENWNISKDGKEVCLLTNGIPITDDNGDLHGYRGVDKDITDRKMAEESLANSLSLLLSTLESTADGILVINDEGKITVYNQQFKKLWDIPDELFFKQDDNLLLEYVLDQLKEPDEFLKRVNYLYSQPEEISFDTIYFKDGRIFERYSQPQKIGKAIIGRVWSFRDITDRKNAEEELKDRDKIYRDLIEKANIAISIEDRDGNILYSNKINASLLGYTIAEMQRKNIKDLVHPDDYENTIKNHQNRLEGEDLGKYEFRAQRKDGSLIWMEVDGVKIVTNGKVIGTRNYFWDITERKNADEEMRDLTHYLQTVREKERKEIAREIHDELGQVLTALKLDLVMIENDIPKKQTYTFKRIDTMTKLINESIRTIHRIATQLRPGILDDLGLVAGIEWLLSEFTKHSSLSISSSISINDSTLSSDITIAIFRIVQETLTNVVRHSEAKKVSIDLSEDNKNFLLEISDNGKGISEGQINNPRSLGLIGIRERVAFLKGSLSVRGIKNEGTTISATISKGNEN